MAEVLGVILVKIVAILLAAKLGGELFERLKQPAVVGELLAGIVMGPTVFGVIDLTQGAAEGARVASASADAVTAAAGFGALAQIDVLKFVAGLGAILLLFEVGLESNVRQLLQVGASATWVALLGIVVSFALGFGASYIFSVLGAWPDSTLIHIFVGATFTATSVGITARVLSDMGKLVSREARIILGAAVLDDVGGLLILAIVSGLAAGSLTAFGIVQTAAIAIGFLVVSVLVGMAVMPRITTFVVTLKSRGFLLVTAFGFALVMAYLAEVVHLAGIVGAFAAGLILAQTKEHHEIADGVRPLSLVFVPFFFVALGLQVNLREIPLDMLGLTLGLAAVLTVVAILGKLACGLGVVDRGVSRYAVGVGMVPRGEVGLIFASFGLVALHIETWVYAALLIVVMVTTVLTPLWLRHAFRGVEAHHPATPAAPPAPPDHP